MWQIIMLTSSSGGVIGTPKRIRFKEAEATLKMGFLGFAQKRFSGLGPENRGGKADGTSDSLRAKASRVLRKGLRKTENHGWGIVERRKPYAEHRSHGGEKE
jgi:hypothetical protein